MDELSSFIGGVLVGLGIMIICWISWEGVQKTTDGQYYIRTHTQTYLLQSDKPVEIKTRI